MEILVKTKKNKPFTGPGLDKKTRIDVGYGQNRPTKTTNKRRPVHNIIKNKIQKTLYRKPLGKRTGSKSKTERRHESDTAERKANTYSPTTISGEEIEKLTKQGRI